VKLSQSFAEGLLDGIEWLESLIGEILLSKFLPQMLYRIDLRAMGWLLYQPYVTESRNGMG